MNNEFVNHGVLLGARPDDYVGGTLPYEIRNPEGDWTSYLPTGEIQYNPKVDFKDCVSRSYTNCIEIQEKFLTGIENNYSDRFLAKRSETTPQGNYLYKVADFGRNEGLVKQENWPDTDGDWDEQYKDPSMETLAKLLEEGKEWLEKWDVKNEDIPITKESFKKHLKQAPLQVVIPGHAVVTILSNKDIEKVFDSYSPHLKQIPPDYPNIVFAKKIVLYKKEQALDADTLLVDLKLGDSGKQILRLKRALERLGWIGEPGDLYDYSLAKLILNYQKANYSHFTWPYWWALWRKGQVVDAYLRNNINNNLTKRK